MSRPRVYKRSSPSLTAFREAVREADGYTQVAARAGIGAIHLSNVLAGSCKIGAESVSKLRPVMPKVTSDLWLELLAPIPRVWANETTIGKITKVVGDEVRFLPDGVLSYEWMDLLVGPADLPTAVLAHAEKHPVAIVFDDKARIASLQIR